MNKLVIVDCMGDDFYLLSVKYSWQDPKHIVHVGNTMYNNELHNGLILHIQYVDPLRVYISLVQ